MSKGKYSPTVYSKKLNCENVQFDKNCYGQVPAEWSHEVADRGVQYDEKTMFGNYDDEGFDSYGYSAFDDEKNYVGIGNGVDRKGYTEWDYLEMSDEEFESHY